VTIDPALITRYIEWRQQQGPSPRTINIELGLLKKLLRLAYDNGKLLRVPRIAMLKEPPPRSGFFEDHQHRSVFKHLPSYLQPVAEFLYLTGWRKNEVLELPWSSVDFKGGVVRLEPGTTKSGEGRNFPMFPALRGLLESQRAYTDSVQRERGRIVPWVFHRDGSPIKSFRKAWKGACKKAGVPGRLVHDYRRTAIRNMVRMGIHERVTMQLAGHKTRSVFDRYNIISLADIEEAREKLAR